MEFLEKNILVSGIDIHLPLESDVNLLTNKAIYYICTTNGNELNLPQLEMYGMLYVLRTWDIVTQLIFCTNHIYFRCWVSYLNAPSFIRLV